MEAFELKPKGKDDRKFLGLYVRHAVDRKLEELKAKTGWDKRLIVERMIEFAIANMKGTRLEDAHRSSTKR